MHKILSTILTDPLKIRQYLPSPPVDEPTVVKTAKFVMRGAASIGPIWASFAIDSGLPALIPTCFRLIPSSLMTFGTYFGGKAIIQIATGENDVASLALECTTVGLFYLSIVYNDLPEKLGWNGILDELGVDTIKYVHEQWTGRPNDSGQIP